MVVMTGFLVTALAVHALIFQLKNARNSERVMLYYPSGFLTGLAWRKLGQVALESVAAKVPSERVLYELRVLLGSCCSYAKFDPPLPSTAAKGSGSAH